MFLHQLESRLGGSFGLVFLKEQGLVLLNLLRADALITELGEDIVLVKSALADYTLVSLAMSVIIAEVLLLKLLDLFLLLKLIEELLP